MALKFARDKDQVKENWKKIFTFGVFFHRDDRKRILIQTLTLYIVNLFDMEQTEVKELNKKLPENERDWIDEIPEIFGEKWKKKGLREGRAIGRAMGLEEGRAEGRAEGSQAMNRIFTLKTIQKFPQWSDAEVADFVGVTLDFVKQIRRELSA